MHINLYVVAVVCMYDIISYIKKTVVFSWKKKTEVTSLMAEML